MTVFLSDHIIDELSRVLPRINHRLGWTPQKLEEEIDLLALQARMVEPAALPETVVRDASDIAVLGTLLASRADYLVTGDKDLLTLAGRHAIVTPAAFWRRHG